MIAEDINTPAPYEEKIETARAEKANRINADMASLLILSLGDTSSSNVAPYWSWHQFARQSVWQVQLPSISTEKQLEEEFKVLALTWKQKTGGVALTFRRFAHPSYHSILVLGKSRNIVPLILNELRERPDWWFEALKFLTKADPTKPGDTFNDATNAWLNWGRRNGLIS